MGVAVHDRLVAADPRVVVDVTRLGHADDGMDEEVGLHLLGRPQGELVVGTVQRVAGLEGDHPAPAQAGELGPQLRRRAAQRRVVVVGGQLDALQGAGQVVGVRPLEQVGDARMGGVGRPEDPLGLRPQSWPCCSWRSRQRAAA